jgi:hypothetical protein
VTAASFYEIDEWVVDDRSGRHVFTGETDTITDLADGFRGTGLGRAVPRPPAGGLFLAAWGLTRYKGLGWRLDADAGGAEYHVPIRTARRRPASTELYLRETASRAGSVQLVRATSSRHAATPLKPSAKKEMRRLHLLNYVQKRANSELLHRAPVNGEPRGFQGFPAFAQPRLHD